MGRRKKRSNIPEKRIDIDEDVDDIEQNFDKGVYDEIDKFHMERDRLNVESDSEDSIGSMEEEVLGIGESDDASEEEETDHSEDNDGIPSSKAWGKKKSMYYGAESVEGLQGVDRDDVEDAEEEEALKIQQRLAEEVDEDQLQLFQLSGFSAPDVETKEKETEKVSVDIHSLSTKAQWKLVKQESPELKELIADFKEKSNELQSTLLPLLNLVKSGKITGNGAIFVQTKFNLYVSYLLNISFYMSLKAKRQPVIGHPVIKRLVQYRTLINKLSRVDDKVENEIEELLSDIDSPNEIANQSVLNSITNHEEAENEATSDVVKSSQFINATPAIHSTNDDSQRIQFTLSERIRIADEEKAANRKEMMNEDNAEDEDRRGITYTMSKNKGAQTKRRKTDRNPRVKFRERYRKAKIRQKGQVRTYRSEMQKYTGEATGIRAGVVHSRKIQWN